MTKSAHDNYDQWVDHNHCGDADFKFCFEGNYMGEKSKMILMTANQ